MITDSFTFFSFFAEFGGFSFKLGALKIGVKDSEDRERIYDSIRLKVVVRRSIVSPAKSSYLQQDSN